MGIDCTNFDINKVCICNNISVKPENKEVNNSIGNENKDNKKEDENNLYSMDKIVSINNKKIKPSINSISQQENNLTPAQLNLISNQENADKHKTSEIKKTKTGGFTDFVDINFNNFETVDKNDVFENNYITVKDNYNVEMLEYLNKIRNNPKSIMEDIDDLFKDDNFMKNQKFQIENEETHENIIFDDENALKDAKIFLYNAKSIEEKFILNDDLLIDISEVDKKVDTNLNKKITNILVEKRKKIIRNYPNCQFFVNFIKDVKINLIYLLSENAEKSNFRNVVFDNKYTDFNVAWLKEKNNNFISFLCFA